MLKEKIISAGLDIKRPILGLSDEEIEEIERHQAVKLPAQYKLFLKECGKSAGLLFNDVDFSFPSLKYLKQELKVAIEENGADFLIADNAFVFSAYQGSQYLYFICDQDDPPTFRVYDDGTVESGADSFSELIEKVIEDWRSTLSDEHLPEIEKKA
ncbi:SMI1/KNR4 family protein [Lysobacter capsici]|uniref:SMI1/KNR4 family protein n=1 Tax=Lysobacter capsici TaxID=435897 RepID=UPI001C0006CF|nr:SMI1/KNR4 family protein [Lysobacter capsici]QWF18439.1 SMI1/KNR4 family protein [Lysobacter capsici]